MKFFLLAILATVSINSFAEDLNCFLDLSSTDLNSEELQLVTPVLENKKFIDDWRLKNKYSVMVTNQKENSFSCVVKISVNDVNSNKSRVVIEEGKFKQLNGDTCSLALVSAIQAIPSCKDLVKLSSANY